MDSELIWFVVCWFIIGYLIVRYIHINVEALPSTFLGLVALWFWPIMAIGFILFKAFEKGKKVRFFGEGKSS